MSDPSNSDNMDYYDEIKRLDKEITQLRQHYRTIRKDLDELKKDHKSKSSKMFGGKISWITVISTIFYIIGVVIGIYLLISYN
jgi:Mg2+ and Co2+ transporter CorA